LNIASAKINLAGDSFQMCLLTASYVPTPDVHATWANVSTQELATGAGYTAGGAPLSAPACTLTGSQVSWTTSSATWAAASMTAKFAVIVKRAGASVASTDYLVGFVDLNTASGSSTITGQGGNLTISPQASGWLTLTHSP